MALLIGRHVHRIDKKGRVSTPKPFRDVFTAQGFGGLYAFRSLKAPAIEACGEDFMARVSTSLDDRELGRINAGPDGPQAVAGQWDDIASVILENAYVLPFDPEGRIVLPKELLDHAGIGERALFIGLGARIQIWHPVTHEERRNHAFERARSDGGAVRPPLAPPGDEAS